MLHTHDEGGKFITLQLDLTILC